MWRGDGKLMFAMKEATPGPATAKLSPDGKWIAVSTETNTLRICDAANGQPVGNPIPLREPKPMLLFSPDSQRLAVRAASSEADLWTVPSGGHAVGPINGAAEIVVLTFSPDSQWLFLGCSGGRGVIF